MPRRKREPDEVIEPALDGLDQIERLELALRPVPEETETVEEEAAEPEQEPRTAIICGNGEIALACARLASECGFILKYVKGSNEPGEPGIEALADETVILAPEDDMVEKCGINANSFVCIFSEDPDQCENLLFQCLDSDAAYIGAWASGQQRKEIFDKLRQDGAPDAELAAICCPMGLGIGSETPAQDAVAVVAEMLAARSGVLKRLRYRP